MAKGRYKALVRVSAAAGVVEVGETLELEEAEARQLLDAGFLEPLKPAARKAAAKPKPAAKKKAPAARKAAAKPKPAAKKKAPAAAKAKAEAEKA